VKGNFIAPLLIVVGIGLCGYGLYTCWKTPSPTETVTRFLEAVQAGDQAGAIACLSSTQRALAEKRMHPEGAPWAPSPDLEYKIQKVEISGRRAAVHVILSEDGFKLRPVFDLLYSDEDGWKISEIRSLDVDPAWTRTMREQQEQEARRRAEQDARLAEELAKALEGVPGAMVKRADFYEPLRR